MKDKLNVKKLGLSVGIVMSIGMFVLGLSAMLFNWGSVWVELIQTVYRGYDSSFAGSLAGAVYGFIDGFIGGALIAWFYNKIK